MDALRWLWTHAEDYGFDGSRTVLTGFSAGGNLSFTVPLRHGRELRSDRDTTATARKGRIAGIVAFYPSVNHAILRQQKADSNPVSKTKGREPAWLHDLVDRSYYRDLPPEGRASLNMSPALAPEEALREDLPGRIAIFTCEYDKLLVEGEDFWKALKGLGKSVGGRMIEGVGHGFDKKPGKYPEKRDGMYREAVEQIRMMI